MQTRLGIGPLPWIIQLINLWLILLERVVPVFQRIFLGLSTACSPQTLQQFLAWHEKAWILDSRWCNVVVHQAGYSTTSKSKTSRRYQFSTSLGPCVVPTFLPHLPRMIWLSKSQLNLRVLALAFIRLWPRAIKKSKSCRELHRLI